jgi:hypothetical protein
MIEFALDSAGLLVVCGNFAVGVGEVNADLITGLVVAFLVDQTFGLDLQILTLELDVGDLARSAFNVAVVTVSGWADCGDAIDSDKDLRLLGRGVKHLKRNRLEPEVCSALLDLLSTVSDLRSSDGVCVMVLMVIPFDVALWDFTWPSFKILHEDRDLEAVLV